MQATQQQVEVLLGSRSNLDFIVKARAGTGKTSVIEMVGRDQMHKNILLLCFNKDIRVAAEKRMPANVTCKTFHQLAWPTYGKYFEPQMKLHFYPKKIARLLRCDESLVNVARETVRKFTASNDRVITGFHVPYYSFVNKSKEEQNTFKEDVVSAARTLWMHKTNIKNREVPVDFDDWLKMFELEGRVRGQFDMVIVDEGQDVTPRDLSIVNKIQSQKMIVGDDFQQLYAWRGSVNSLDDVGIEDELFLTQSFRFGDAVADKANQVLALLNHKTPPLIGYKSIDSQISWDNKPTERHTVLCRTNAGLLSHAMDVIRKGKTIHVVGNMADMIRRLESAWYLSIGDLQKVTHPGVSLIGDWAALLELAHTDTEIKMLVQQVTKYNSSIPNICAELKAAGEYSEHSADIILSTVHKCVHPDTWVETPNGLMRIKDIPNHGMISTPFGVSSYEGKFTREESDTLILTTKRGYRIEVTHDHGMTVWRNSDHERVVASELKEGDLLRVQLGYHMDVVNYPSLPKHNGNIDPRTKIYSLPTVMTELLGEFLGLMVADGTVYKRGFKLTKRHLDVAERFKELVIELFDFDPKYFENLGTPGYDVNSVYLADWLKSLGGLCPNEKSIPDIILQSPMSVQSAFIRGLFEDGTVNMKDGVTDHIHFETKSETLARTVQTMLIRFGIISTVKHRISNDRPISTIYIYGGNIRIFADKIGFVSRFKNERLEDLPDCLKSNDYIPISVDELNAIRKYITIYDYQNAKSRSRISRCKVENLLNPSRNELEFLRDRMNWHYDPIVSIEKSRSVTMCITVNNGSRFIQNGFDGWNSKGLEWDIVRLAEDFPEELVVFKHRERTYEVKKSEVYCLYVAVTRAKQKLYVNSTISQLKHWKTLLGE